MIARALTALLTEPKDSARRASGGVEAVKISPY
jgi:hypothetical protein